MNRKATFFGLGLTVIAAAFIGYLLLHNKAEVADVISDELVWDLRDSSPQKKVIVTKDGTVARYVSEDETSYTGDIQDTFTVSKEEATVEIWYACEGKGIVFLKNEGTKPAYAAPDSLSNAVGNLEAIEGYYPEVYCCKGYKDGWFTIEIDGTEGYIREEYVYWDAICSF